MTFLPFTFYLINDAIYLIIGIMLLTVKSYSNYANAYSRIKQSIACVAFIEVIKNIIISYFTYKENNLFLLNSFTIPLIYYVQLLIITSSILNLIHLRFTKTHKFYLFFIPVVFLLIGYIIVYSTWQNPNPSFSIKSYASFTSSKTSKIFSKTIYIIIALEIMIYLYQVFKTEELFKKEPANISLNSTKKDNTSNTISYLFLGYLILSASNFVITNTTFNYITLCINASLFIIAAISIMNLNIQPIYNIDPVINQYSETIKTTEEHDAISRNCNLNLALSEWTKRPDKPFLNDDITLASVAESLNVSPRLLSGYLNQIHTTNFNTWINKLRIQEVKKLIDDNSHKTLAQIAIQTGFTDQAAMTNTFKRLTNMTPSEYKKLKPQK